ncbi:MAG: polysaccharide deacetylase [Gemmatimonadetes bacterium]|nr:polysaccharide deacetylase [Gemmatimonadota bacterium]
MQVALRRDASGVPRALLQRIPRTPLPAHDLPRGAGAPAGTRSVEGLAPAFGHSFAAIRVHAVDRAEDATGPVDDIRPSTGSRSAEPVPTLRRSLEIGAVDAPEEREAEAAAAAAISGGAASVDTASAARVQRAPDGGAVDGGTVDGGTTRSDGGLPTVVPLDGGTVDGGVPTTAPAADAGTTDAGPQADAASGRTLLRTGGYTGKDAKGVVRIAWTFDDGPTAFTAGMQGSIGARPATWFVMSNQLGTGDARKQSLAQLVERQKAGDEVALHSFHPTTSHVCWFPAATNGCAAGYAATTDAMAALTGFTAELRNAGLTIHFVRPPTGLHDELTAYLATKGMTEGEADTAFRAMLAAQGTPGAPTGLDPRAVPVKADFDLLLKTLADNGLHLWGGGASAAEVTGNDWEAESSGVKARADTLLGEGAKLDAGARQAKSVEKFPAVLAQIAAGKRASASFIVLAHDTTAADVKQVANDVKTMEDLATAAKVTLEYHTESELYAAVRGRQP